MKLKYNTLKKYLYRDVLNMIFDYLKDEFYYSNFKQYGFTLCGEFRDLVCIYKIKHKEKKYIMAEFIKYFDLNPIISIGDNEKAKFIKMMRDKYICQFIRKKNNGYKKKYSRNKDNEYLIPIIYNDYSDFQKKIEHINNHVPKYEPLRYYQASIENMSAFKIYSILTDYMLSNKFLTYGLP